jgi:hypothetical protein
MGVVAKKEVLNEIIVLFKVISIGSYTTLYTNLPCIEVFPETVLCECFK